MTDPPQQNLTKADRGSTLAWSAYLLASVYFVGIGFIFLGGKAIPMDPFGAIGSLQRAYAGDRVRLREYVDASRERLERLQATYPALRAYEKARDGTALSVKKREGKSRLYTSGTHQAFGRDFYVDEHGFRYADQATYERVSARRYAKKVLVLGGSVGFGFSPASTVSFSDVMNDRQRVVRFYNASIPGADCGTADDSVKELAASTKIKFDRVLLYQGINYLPFGCDPNWLADATRWQDVERWQEQIARRTQEIRSYDGRGFLACAELVLEPARRRGIGITFVTTSLAYNEQLRDTELYDEMLNGHCTAKIQLAMIRKHNQVVHELGRRHPDVQVIDASRELLGHSEYFWDAVHLSPRGNQRMADLLLNALVAH